MQHDIKVGYFSIKVSERENRTVSFLTNLILQHWEQNKQPKSVFRNTYLQKVLFKISNTLEEFNFITRGWYKYGGILVQSEDSTLEQEITAESLGIKDETRIKEFVFSICDEYNPNSNATEWQKKQYNDYNNIFYLSALEFKECLKHPHISIQDSRNILFKLQNVFPENEILINETKDVFDMFVTLADYEISDTNAENREVLLDTFNAIWDLFATYNLYVTVKGEKETEMKNILERTFEGIRITAINSLLELKNNILPIIRTDEIKLNQSFEKSKMNWKNILEKTNGDVHKASEIFDLL